MALVPRWRFAAAALLALALPALAENPPVKPPSTGSSLATAAAAAAPLLNRASLEAQARQAVIAEDFVFKATLKVERPGPSLPGREVKFTLDGVAACTARTDAHGLASCHFKIPPIPQAVHTYEAHFAGGDGLTSAKVEAKILIAKAQTKLNVGTGGIRAVPGEPISIHVHLKRTLDDTGIDGKLVSLRFNGTDIGNVTTVKDHGERNFTIPASAEGALRLEASFAGDDFYIASSASASVAVERKAWISVLSAPFGTVGVETTYKVRVTKVPQLPGGQPVLGTGIGGQKVSFSTCLAGEYPNCFGPWHLGDATTDGNGLATLTARPEHAATKLRIDLSKANGWLAGGVEQGCVVAMAVTHLAAQPVAGKLFTKPVLKVRAFRKPDEKGRAGAKIQVTKIDQMTLSTPFSALTDSTGNASIPIVAGGLSVGLHSLTVVADKDPSYTAATINVPFTVLKDP